MANGLDRFVTAQDSVWTEVEAELTAGAKRSHWMWFVFPQIAGLGFSPTARRYAIASLDEACAYLGHPWLGPRLRHVTALMLTHRGRPADEILGPIDAVKLRSCLTLFTRADPAEPLFHEALAAFYDGLPDPRTLALLEG